MKRKFIIFLAGTLCLISMVSGCSKKEKESEKLQEVEVVYADNSFIEDMAKGLQSRWESNLADEKKEGYDEIYVDSKEYQDMMLGYIDKELNVIEKYTEEKFEDKKLQEMALKYINLLRDHKEICALMTVNYEQYEAEFQPIYNERSKIIEAMVKDYGMSVEDEYQNFLNDFIANSQMVVDEERKEEAINQMIASVHFEMVQDDGSGYKTYQAVVENNTGIDFNTFSVSINLLNADGIIVETVYDQVSAFKNGSKAQFEFYTDKEFVSTEITVEWWE